MPDDGWFSVRCVFRSTDDGLHVYEERVTLRRAESFDQAVVLAEADAAEYAHDIAAEYVGLAQAFRLPEQPSHGAEVFSLCRTSELSADDYLDHFFDTGDERQRGLDDR